MWTVVSYVAGLTMAVAMFAVSDAIVPWVLALGLSSSWVLILFYRERAANLQRQRTS